MTILPLSSFQPLYTNIYNQHTLQPISASCAYESPTRICLIPLIVHQECLGLVPVPVPGLELELGLWLASAVVMPR
jgi:hypothetical protein